MPHPPIFRTLVLALALSLPASAQDERWYQVELLVFSHQTGPAASAEQWPATPRLAYPGAARFLVEPPRVAANLAANEGGESEVDEFGRQFISFPEPVEPVEEDETALGTDQNLPGEPELPAHPETLSEPTEELQPPATPTPFVALPRSAREFDGKAAYMQRTGKYRTLFHQTWLQPVKDENNALPMILDRSGDDGDWPLLQGSVKLYLSRYLHLETNLWINTDGSYLPGEWRMPAPPLGPVSLVVAERPVVEEEMIEGGGEAGLFGVEAVPEQEEVTEEMDIEPEPVYSFRHAVLMQQKRRMRSKEVHYIDHPMLGVVVRLTPVEEDYLQALATAELEAQAEAAATADQAP